MEEQWRTRFATGSEAWPALRGSPDHFRRMVDDGGSDLYLPDLFLAAACASGEELALKLFFEQYDRHLRAIMGSIKASVDQQDEARQLVETQLFVGSDSSPPKIMGYRGKGPLLAYLRVVAVRTLRHLIRRQIRGEQTDDELLKLVSTTENPEFSYLKRLYQREFASAFTTALAQLEPRQRTLLRYVIVDGLTIDKISALYEIHRATAARHVVDARSALVKKTKSALQASLKVDRDQLESILRLVDGSVDVSVRRLLVE